MADSTASTTSSTSPTTTTTKTTQPARNTREYRNINAIVDLPKYRLPLAGLVSILHRISGFIMAALLPAIVWLLDQSLTSEYSYANLAAYFDNVCVKLFVLGVSWAFFHHLCAGLRHLMMDLHIGMDKESSKTSAIIVLTVSLTFTALVAFKLFGGLIK